MAENDKHIKTIETILFTAATNGESLVQETHVPALKAAVAALRRTAEDDKAREEGLPCNVGDTLYEPYQDGLIDEAKVSEIEISICTNMGVYGPDDIGKTVFLTRQEAEAALEAQKGADQ